MCIEKVKKLIYQYGILVFLTALIVIGYAIAGKVKQYYAWDKYVESASSIEQQIQLLEEKELVESDTVSLCLQGKELPYIKSRNAFMISQKINPDDSEKEQNFQGMLSVHGMDAMLFIEQDEYTDKLTSAIEEGHLFHAYLITDDAYQPVNIVLSGMPIVTLSTEYSETPEYSIEQIDDYVYNSETRYYGEIGIYDNTEISGYDVCFHEKGQTSAIFDKHNYALKLLDTQGDGVEASMFGMPSSEKWKLQALYADVTKVREKTALDLWEEIANAERMTEELFRENGAQMEYCEVIVDGEYQGLYGMMYPVNEDTLQMKSDDVLYKVHPHRGASGPPGVPPGQRKPHRPLPCDGLRGGPAAAGDFPKRGQPGLTSFVLSKKAEPFPTVGDCGLLRAPSGHTGRPSSVFWHAHVAPENL